MQPEKLRSSANATVEKAIVYWSEVLQAPWEKYISIRSGSEVRDQRLKDDYRDNQLRRYGDFLQAVEQSRNLLTALAAEGADPLYILSVMIRYGWRKGTEHPSPVSVTFECKDFKETVPSGQDLTLWAECYALGHAVPIRADARKVITQSFSVNVRRRGPAEAYPTNGMVVLARHLRISTGRPHHKEIAEIFSIWAPWLRSADRLEADDVRRRINYRQRGQALTRIFEYEDKFHLSLGS